jgi:hypothetical protein
MNPENRNAKFGPAEHENSLPAQPEVQAPTQPTAEVGIHPDDPESKKALIRLNKLRAEGADAESITQAENAVAEAGNVERQAAEVAARAEIAKIQGTTEQQETPYQVRSTKNIRRRPVPINLHYQPTSPSSGTSHLYGSNLAEHVRQLVRH